MDGAEDEIYSSNRILLLIELVKAYVNSQKDYRSFYATGALIIERFEPE